MGTQENEKPPQLEHLLEMGWAHFRKKQSLFDEYK